MKKNFFAFMCIILFLFPQIVNAESLYGSESYDQLIGITEE